MGKDRVRVLGNYAIGGGRWEVGGGMKKQRLIGIWGATESDSEREKTQRETIYRTINLRLFLFIFLFFLGSIQMRIQSIVMC